MAVVRIESELNFVGLSTDTKPTGVPVGSDFYETDTQDRYLTYDGTNWVVDTDWQTVINANEWQDHLIA